MLEGFEDLVDLTEGEVVTHSYVRDVPLPSGRVLALVTLDNDRDHTRPNTFGPASLFELNEAFAVQVLSFLDHFGIDDDDPRVNEYGGAIAVGHPLASSGVRLMIQLARQFEAHPEVRYGLTAMCVGLGQGGSVIWENPHFDGKAARRKGR